MKIRQEGLFVFIGAVLVLAVGCGPTYPECHDDSHCAEKSEYCVNAKCAQCRDDGHCQEAFDESYVCNGGSCQRIVGFCHAPNFTCPGKQKCRDWNGQVTDGIGRCGAECLGADECPAGFSCENGSCIAPPECTVDADCPTGQVCKNLKCITPPVCQPREIYFDFDESTIRTDAKSTLEENATCFKERESEGKASAMDLVGHCDERGTEEYNLALGERRAKAARKIMRNNGISKSDIKTRSRGEYDLAVPNARSESQHQKNRRVVFEYE